MLLKSLCTLPRDQSTSIKYLDYTYARKVSGSMLLMKVDLRTDKLSDDSDNSFAVINSTSIVFDDKAECAFISAFVEVVAPKKGGGSGRSGGGSFPPFYKLTS